MAILLKLTDVVKEVGLSRPTIIKLEKEGKFPRRKQLTEGRVAWLHSEIMTWAEQL